LNAYEILRVSIDASQEQIERAFAKEQEKWSPDRHNGEKTEEKAKQRLLEVTHAYDQIATGEARKSYSAGLKVKVEPVQQVVAEEPQRAKGISNSPAADRVDTLAEPATPASPTYPVGPSDRPYGESTYPVSTHSVEDPSSRYVIPGLLLFAVIAAVAIGISSAGRKPPAPAYVPEPVVVANVELPKLIEPSFANAVEQVFSMPAVTDAVRTGANEQTSLFADVPFGSSQNVFRAVFLKTQKIESTTGEIEACHACAPSISAVVYQKTGDAWAVFSVSKFFTDFGAWGDATVSSPVEILYDLAPRTVAFLFNFGWTGQGYSSSGKAIFALSDSGFRELGYLTLAEDNEGACDDTIDEPKDPNKAPLPIGNKCWKNTGVYTVDKSPKGAFAAIRVTRFGTESDKDGNVVDAPDWIYRVTAKNVYEREKSD
jgi:hypothetical protein